MVLVYGEAQRETPTLGNGIRGGPKAMVCIPGLMATATRENFATVSSTARVSNASQMAILIRGTTKMESPQVMANIFGPVAVFSKEISKLVLEMGKEYGKRALEEAISIKENGSMIKSKAMEYLHGLTGVSTKDTTKTISERDLDN